jgi:hypothetical protein
MENLNVGWFLEGIFKLDFVSVDLNANIYGNPFHPETFEMGLNWSAVNIYGESGGFQWKTILIFISILPVRIEC